jgi:hypothetical protein
MAFVALKANSCIDLRENNLALKMEIFDKTCDLRKVNKRQCNLSILESHEDVFDFNSVVKGICKK